MRSKGRTVADENPFEQQADERRAVFKGRHGYPAQLVPDVWVGRLVAMNIVGPTRASGMLEGMLEAVKAEGYVVSVEKSVESLRRETRSGPGSNAMGAPTRMFSLIGWRAPSTPTLASHHSPTHRL